MKHSSEIISHIISKKEFKKLGINRCLETFKRLLPPRFANAISFMFIKNNTLNIALTHHGFKLEMYNNLDLLKNILFDIVKLDTNCNYIVFDKIVIFNSKVQKLPILNMDTIPSYAEMAIGEFLYENEDGQMKLLFEQIKMNIKKNRELLIDTIIPTQ